MVAKSDIVVGDFLKPKLEQCLRVGGPFDGKTGPPPPTCQITDDGIPHAAAMDLPLEMQDQLPNRKLVAIYTWVPTKREWRFHSTEPYNRTDDIIAAVRQVIEKGSRA